MKRSLGGSRLASARRAPAWTARTSDHCLVVDTVWSPAATNAIATAAAVNLLVAVAADQAGRRSATHRTMAANAGHDEQERVRHERRSGVNEGSVRHQRREGENHYREERGAIDEERPKCLERRVVHAPTTASGARTNERGKQREQAERRTRASTRLDSSCAGPSARNDSSVGVLAKLNSCG